MTVVERERRRRRRVERKGMGMYGTVGGDLGFAEGDLDRARGARSSSPIRRWWRGRRRWRVGSESTGKRSRVASKSLLSVRHKPGDVIQDRAGPHLSVYAGSQKAGEGAGRRSAGSLELAV